METKILWKLRLYGTFTFQCQHRKKAWALVAAAQGPGSAGGEVGEEIYVAINAQSDITCSLILPLAQGPLILITQGLNPGLPRVD